MSSPSIRPFRPGDTDACYEICLRTGDAGGDASRLHTDPKVLGEVWVAPYLSYAPELSFVIEDDEGVGGYVVGAAHTTEFEDWAEAEWWPRLRDRYPRGTFRSGSADADTVNLIHTPLRMAPEIVGTHPAHLHIDMVPRLQGKGLGRRLLDHLFAGFRAADAAAVHLGVSPLNAAAIAFYERLGFVELVPELVLLGRSTDPTITPTS
jgi:ribosomal protein S18 acetylase RimI-like enzyme